MKKKHLILVAIMATITFASKDVHAFSSNDYRYRSLCGTYEVAGFHADGVIDKVACYNNYEDAKRFMKENGADDLAILNKVGGTTKIIDANVALLDLSVNPETLTYFYTNSELTGSAYTYMDTGSLYGGVDGAHIETAYSNTNNTWVAKVKIGNFTGWIKQSAYEIVPITWVKSSSSYTVTDEIKHNYVAKIQNYYSGSSGRVIGPKPDMLDKGTYYSYDGHYFYKDLTSLIKDYKKNTYQDSVNKNNPYYNYYMYLSNHTKTTYSSINIDEYIRTNLGYKQNVYGNSASAGTSRLYGSGTFFYHAQEKYGVNAILALSLSRNETGNGTSNLAINKNNGFGLNAVDSSPTESANWYATFSSSILGYASKWITYGYAHPRDWRYFGPQFGDKWIGMNVKYASDTYWSEKMAANYYSLDKAFGLQDYNYYQLGVVKTQTNAYSEPSTSSKFIYSYPEKEDALVIVDEVTKNNEKWYKVVSDLNIDSNYNEVTSGDYNWGGFVYVKQSDVVKINTSKNGYISPNEVTEYQDKDYEYDLYISNTELKPKVAYTIKNTPYYYDPTLTSKTGNTLLKDRYVMVYTAAYLNNRPVAFLVTSDYFHDQKEWVSADSINFTNTNYGKVSVTVPGNQYTWVNYNTDDAKYSLISGLYTNSYVPILEAHKVGNDTWYKVPVNLTSNDNVYGYTLASAPGVKITLSTPIVENILPTINAVDKTIIEGDEFDELKDVSATDYEDGDLTKKIKVIENTVDTSKVGEYKVTYKVVDSENGETTKTIKVIIKENSAPVINAKDIEVTVKNKFDELKDVSATDKEDGDLTKEIKVIEKNVDTSKIGTYKVIYEVTDLRGKTTTKEIKVKVVDDEKPVINASDKTIIEKDKFDELKDVSATDKEDGDLTKKIKVIENNVNTNKAGKYSVIYQVKDSFGNITEKEITVEVVEREEVDFDLDDLDDIEDFEDLGITEKDSIFYFDYLNEVDNKLEIKGYNVIKGIDNDLKKEIVHVLALESLNDDNVEVLLMGRITDKKEITRPVYSTDEYDYTYSWFKGEIDTSKIPDGDYRLYVISISKEYYSASIISNKVLRTQVPYFKGDKYVTTRNNYLDNDLPLELIVRSEKVGTKTTSSIYNMYNQYRTLEFKNNELHIKGTSYSYGMNLSKDSKVERKIIFENTSTYKKYTFNLGSITDGLYEVGATLGDNLKKDRAWFDATIDITNIPKGNYAIYISTTSNVSDYGELNEILGRNISNIKLTSNGKTYSFKTNEDNRYRIELNVK